MSPPSLTKARSQRRRRRHVRQQLVGDRAGHRRHRRDEHVGEGPAGRDHAPRHGAVDVRLLVHGRAQRGKLVAQLRQDGREASAGGLVGRAHGVGAAPGLQHDVDRPVRQVQAVAGQLLDDGRREHRLTRSWPSARTQGGGLAGGQRLQRLARDVGGHAPSWPVMAALPAGVSASSTRRASLRVGRLAHVAARDQPADHAGDGGRVHGGEAAELVLRHRPRSSSLASAANCVGVTLNSRHHGVEGLGRPLVRTAQQVADLVLEHVVGSALRRVVAASPACASCGGGHGHVSLRSLPVLPGERAG